MMKRIVTGKLIKIIFNTIVLLFIPVLPAFAAVSVLGELTHEMNVKPGDKRKGEVVLHNNGTEEVLIQFYIRDYFFNSDGRAFYLKPDSLERSNSSWIKLERSRVYIPPDHSASIQYTLTVPQDGKKVGTYWSILMAEPVVEEINPLDDEEKIKVSIQEKIRYGIQIVTSFGDTGKKEIEFIRANLAADERGDLTLSVDLANQGEQWLVPDVWVDIYREDGTLVGRFKGSHTRMFPETSIRQKLKIGYLEDGKYMALVVADDGDEFVVGAEYTLNVGK